MALSTPEPGIAVAPAGSSAARVLRLLVLVSAVACGAFAADECAAVTADCRGDPDCLGCLEVETAPAGCAATATTCDGWWDMACCLYGGSSACLESDLLVRHLQCLAQGNDCTIDGVCPGGATDDPDGPDGGSTTRAAGDDDGGQASIDPEDEDDVNPEGGEPDGGAGAIGGAEDGDGDGEGNDLGVELTGSPGATLARSAALALVLPIAVSGVVVLL